MRRIATFLIGTISCVVVTSNVFAQNPFAGEEVKLLTESSLNSENIIGEIDNISQDISSILGNAPTTSNGDYNVVKGNTLSGIAKKLLGDASRWRDLVEWNLDRYPSLMKNPDLILVGWQLRLSPPGPNPAQNNQTPPLQQSSSSNQSDQTMENTTNNQENISSVPQSTNSSAQSGPIIKPDSRVLHIGDSHTCGIYGKAMDEMMRGTGAAINTYGVSGSSPSWWLNGTVGKSGYFAKDENGRVDQPSDWRTPRTTPNLNDLIRQTKPSVIVFSLGANMIHATPEAIQAQVKSVCEIAKKAGCQIVWIGPPNGRADKKPETVQNRLCENLKSEAEKYGTYIDSRPYTHYPSDGGDGVHYWGTEGSKIAKEWAGKIFENMQKPAK